MWEPEHKEMTAATKTKPHAEAASWEEPRAEHVSNEVRPMFSGKATGQSTGEAWRGTGPSTYTRIVEITSGRSLMQQGAGSNLQRPTGIAETKPVGGFGTVS